MARPRATRIELNMLDIEVCVLVPFGKPRKLMLSDDDTLTGGAGADTLVFNSNFGKETVTDYNVSQDVLALSHTLFTNDPASQVLSQTHDSKAGAVIVVDAGDTVTLTGVTVAQLAAAQQAHVDCLHFFLSRTARTGSPPEKIRLRCRARTSTLFPRYGHCPARAYVTGFYVPGASRRWLVIANPCPKRQSQPRKSGQRVDVGIDRLTIG